MGDLLGFIPVMTSPSTSVKYASINRRARNSRLVSLSACGALTKLSFLTLRSPTTPLLRTRASGEVHAGGPDFKRRPNSPDLLKYPTVGVAIWLGDPGARSRRGGSAAA